ncbi:MAG: hypothetical protein K8R39_01500 [Arcobacteraceae bacterium]|nr:hypothetical protein [Arcobacteraceae bacterium]
MKLFHTIIASFMVVAMATTLSMAAPAPTNAKKQTPQGIYLTAVEAYELVKKEGDKILFIDVRTPYEFQYVGSTPMVDKNIPIVLITLTKWDEKKQRYVRTMNKNFVQEVEAAMKAKGLTKKDKIVFMCRSGKRSIYTSKLMAKEGYMNVATIVDGFEGGKDKKYKQRTTNTGWKNTCPPESWGYKNHKEKMYFSK